MPLLPAILIALALFALGLCAYAYVGYALLVRLVVRPIPAVEPGGERSQGEAPFLSVLVAARNEAAVIEERIRNLLAQSYPADRFEVLVASDASEDGTDAIIEGIGDPRVRLVRQEQRSGKTAAINRIAPLARGEILVQTDANVMFSSQALTALAAAFGDPRVGVALGEVVFTNDDRPEVAGGEGLYWRFETWVKKVEAERGLLAVANGGIYALRRGLWQPLPTAIAGDAAEPLLAAIAGYRTVIAPGARATERAADSLREEYSRKARIIAQQVACARWLTLRKLPARTAWSYVSHKLLRYLVPLLWGAALGLLLAAGVLGSIWGFAGAAAIALPLLIAPLGTLRLPGRLSRWCHVPLYLVVVNLAALAGLWRGLTGQAQATWEIPSSTRAADLQFPR